MHKINDVIASLLKGNVVILPTDTVYALACLSDRTESIKKIYDIKKRRSEKNLQIFVSDIEMAHKYAIINTIQQNLIALNPGPFTFILPTKNKIITGLFSLGTIGIRIAPSRFLYDIITGLDQPIIATSCNISGEKDAVCVADISSHILHNVDLVVDQGNTLHSCSSCIVDISNQNIIILRHGPKDFKYA